MANEIIKKDISVPSTPTTTINVHPKANYFEYVETLNYSGNIYNISTVVNGHRITSNLKPNNDYYNLFVLESEEFDKGYFIINNNDVLLYLDNNIQSNYSKSKPETLDVAISYPCLFTNKNASYKIAGPDQLSYFGYLTNIEKVDNGYKFLFSIVSALPQDIFNNNTDLFGIKDSHGENELDKIHWSIKKINLVQSIRSLGHNVAAY